MHRFFKRRGIEILRAFVLLPFLAQTFVTPLFALEEVLPEEQIDIPIDTSEDILDEGISTGPEDEELVLLAEEIVEKELKIEPQEEVEPEWISNGSLSTTNNPVELGRVYVAPQNGDVTLTFTKLPEESGYLTINEIYLTEEEIEATGAASDIAYDITTDMEDGSFEYDLTLPTPIEDIEVVYVEEREEILESVEEVKEEISVNDGKVKIEGLDHFTVYVVVNPNPAGNGNTCTVASINGTCYDTIQGAIDNANDGDTINVVAGTYVENVEINVPNITLQSIEGRDLTIVDNPTVGSETSGISVLANMGTVTVDGFTVNNFRNGIIQGYTQSVGTSFIVKNCKVVPENNDTAPYLRNGIQVSGDYSQVIDNYVVGAPLTSAWASTAIGVVNASHVLVEGNTVNTSAADIGISVSNYNSTLVEDVSIQNNHINGAKNGVRISGNYYANPHNSVQNVLISNNEILNSPTSHGINIQTVILTNLTVIGNEITGHGYSGIRTSSSSATLGGDILISENNISDNTYYGILYASASSVGSTLNVNKNTITGNGWAGISSSNSSPIIVNGNDLSGNASYGIYNSAAYLIDAKNNWWGEIDNSGPYDEWTDGSIPSTNPTGNGISVYGMVDYSNWVEADKVVPATTSPRMFVSSDGGTTFEERTYVTKGDIVRVETDATDNLSGVDYVQFAIKNPSGGYVASYQKIYTPISTGSDTYRFEFTIPTDGRYIDTHKLITEDIDGLNFWVRAYDNAGNYNHGVSNTFTYDKTQPTISQPKMLVSRDGGAFFETDSVKPGDIIKVQAEANDSSSGIRSVEFRIQDKDTGEYVAPRVFEETPISGNTYEYIFEIPSDVKYINTHNPISEEYLQLSYWVRAHDIVGNYAHGKSNLFTLDITDPSIPILKYPINGEYINDNTPLMQWQDSTDYASGVKGYYYRIYFNCSDENNIPASCSSVYPNLDGLWRDISEYQAGTTADRTYYWQVRSVDYADNLSAWSELEKFTIDTLAPEVLITSHTENELVSGIETISGDISDLNLSHYWFVVTNSSGSKVAGPGVVNDNGPSTTKSFSWNTEGVIDGIYTIKLEARDKAGNKNPNLSPVLTDPEVLGDSVDWVSVIVDNTSPTTTFTPDFSESIFSSSITISGQSVDTNNVEGVNLYYRLTGTSTWIPLTTLINPTPSSNTFNWSHTWTPSTDGTYDIKASAYDSLGNTENSPVMRGVIFDTTNPTVGKIKLVVDYISTYVNGKTGFLGRATVVDNLSGIDNSSCQYTLDGINWNNGTYIPSSQRCFFSVGKLPDAQLLNINVRIKDKAGNPGVGSQINRTVDRKLPTVDVNIQDNYYGPNTFTSSTIKGTATDTVSNITSVQLSLRRNSDGKYWRKRIIPSSYAWRHGSLPLNNANGTNSWDYNVMTSAFDNGTKYTVTPYAWDQVHSMPGIGSSDTFTWDEQAPDVTDISILVNGNPSVWARKGDNIKVSALVEDPLSGVKAVSADFSYNSTYTNRPSPTSVLMTNAGGNIYEVIYTVPDTWNEGPMYITVAARDNVDNYSGNRSLAQMITIDNTKPTLSIDSPNSGDILGAQFTTNGFAEDLGSGLDQLRVRFRKMSDNSLVETCFPTVTSNWSLDINDGLCNVPDGNYKIVVRARDLVGNTKFRSLTNVTIDSVKPEIKDITDTLDLSEGEDIPSVTAEVTDDIGLYKAHYVLSNPSLGTFNDDKDLTGLSEVISISDLVKTYAFAYFGEDITKIDTYYIPEGIYTIEYYVEDIAGNLSDTETLTITITNVAPTVDSFTADVLSITEGDTVNFEAIFSDPAYIEYLSGEKHADDADWIYAFAPEGTYLPDSSTSIPGETLTLSHTYNNEGTYIAEFRVCEDSLTDGEGECATETVEIVVSNNAPTLIVSPATSTVTVGTPAVVLGTTVTNGNAPFTYAWTGDCTGTGSGNSIPTDTADTYICTVTVTDADGDISTDQATVVVNAPPAVAGVLTGPEKTGKEEEKEDESKDETPDDKEEVLGESTCEQTYKISGTVFYDKNNDGIKDYNEKGVEGIDVKIYDKDGNLVKTVQTDEEGNWEAYLCPGEYTTEVEGAEDQTFVLGETDNTLNIPVEKKFPWWWIAIIGSFVLILLGVLVDRYKKKEQTIFS